MEVKIKKLHPNAVIPFYAKPGDAGMDLTAVIIDTSNEHYIEYDTGIAVEIPEGYVGLVFPRSSNSKVDLELSNSVGVIDSGYRGSIKLRYHRIWREDKSGNRILDIYSVGDRVGQLIIIPYPKIEFKEVDELSSTERGDGGFGSTSK